MAKAGAGVTKKGMNDRDKESHNMALSKYIKLTISHLGNWF